MGLSQSVISAKEAREEAIRQQTTAIDEWMEAVYKKIREESEVGRFQLNHEFPRALTILQKERVEIVLNAGEFKYKFDDMLKSIEINWRD